MREQRIHNRVPCQMTLNCRNYIDCCGTQKPLHNAIELNILNISVGGFLATANEPLQMEQVLHFTFYLEDVPYIIMSRVRWAEEILDGYAYGLEFLTIPNMMHRHLHDYTQRQLTYSAY